MDDVLAIFPARGLDTSIIVPVYIGFLLHALFTETLGWSFSGLVVTGYLAAVFSISPVAGFVLAVEIVTTYVIVIALSEGVARLGWWHSFFGRERFLAFFIVSLFVRLVYETWTFRFVGTWAVNAFGVPLEMMSHLYGVGLVIVPLTAHSLWHQGLSRGVVQVGVPTALTFLILRHVVEPLTNFSITSFELSFQNLALDFSTSPKIYITLILSMLIAARFNVKLGWDFNGVMIPALLALAWYAPIKLGATLVEATTVALVAYLVARLPIFQRTNLEGPRRLLIVFTVDMAIKFAFGWYMADAAPGFKVSDLYGFGYLLPSLVAVNILEHGSWSLVVGPTLITSFFGFLAGNVVGLFFFHADERFLHAFSLETTEPRPAQVVLHDSPPATLHLAPAQTMPVVPELKPPSDPISYSALSGLLDGVKHLSDSDPSQSLMRALPPSLAEPLNELGLSLSWVTLPTGERLLVLREPMSETADRRSGFGLVAFVSGCRQGLWLEVPFPFEEPLALDAALELIHPLRACGLMVNGWRSAQPQEKELARRRESPYSQTREWLRTDGLIQIRQGARGAALHVSRRLPTGFSLLTIRRLLPEFSITWEGYDPKVRPPHHPRTAFVELVLGEDAVLGLFPPRRPPFSSSALLDVRKRLQAEPDFISPPLSEAYRLPTATEMDFLTDHLIRPIREVIKRSELTPLQLRAYEELFRRRAEAIGYDARFYVERPDGVREVLLIEPETTRRWGVVALRSPAGPWVIEVARPRSDLGLLPLAFDLWGRLDASGLILAGADLNARRDGLADVTRSENPVNPFQAAHQAMISREAGQVFPWVLVLRGLHMSRRMEPDVLVSLPMEMTDQTPRTVLTEALMSDMAEAGLRAELYAGKPDQLGLKGMDSLQVRSVASLSPASVAVLWYASPIRRVQSGFETQSRQSASLPQIGFKEREAFLETLAPIPSDPAPNPGFDSLVEDLERFNSTGQIGLLRKALEEAASRGLTLSLVRDIQSGKTFLLLSDPVRHRRCLVRAQQTGRVSEFLRDFDPRALRRLRYGPVRTLCGGE